MALGPNHWQAKYTINRIRIITAAVVTINCKISMAAVAPTKVIGREEEEIETKAKCLRVVGM